MNGPGRSSDGAAGRSTLRIGVHSVEAALAGAPQRVLEIRIAEECRNPRVRELEQHARRLGVRVRAESRAVLVPKSKLHSILHYDGLPKTSKGIVDAVIAEIGDAKRAAMA